MINWRVRIRNPVFWVQIIMAVLTPLLAYMGLTAADLTSWPFLWDVFLQAVRNPYVLGLIAVSVWNAVNDPTTAGTGDSQTALTYEKPKI